jgi:hypothetical protein
MTVDWEIRCALFETIQLHLKLGPRGGKKHDETIRHRTKEKKNNIVQNFLQVQV